MARVGSDDASEEDVFLWKRQALIGKAGGNYLRLVGRFHDGQEPAVRP